MSQESLFDTDPPTPVDELAAALAELIARYGFDPVESALGRIKVQMAGPVGPAPARTSDPRTSHAKTRRVVDVRRFSNKSQCGKLLSFYCLVGAATDKQAADHVMTPYAEIGKWEGCRRRCSDLRAANYIEFIDTELEARLISQPTPEGRAAFHRMQTTGWTR